MSPKGAGSKQVSAASSVSLKKTVTKKAPVKTCSDIAGASPQVTAGFERPSAVIRARIETNQIFDQSSLVQWVSQWAQELFQNPACAESSIEFSAHIHKDRYTQGLLKAQDYKLKQQGKISLAEWVRRWELVSIDTPVALIQRLKDARASGQHTKALQAVDELLVQFPQDTRYLTTRANTLVDEGSLIQALSVYDQVIELNKNLADVFFNKAYAFKKLGRFSEAVSLYKKTLLVLQGVGDESSHVVPTKDMVLLNLADALLKERELEEAKSVLEQVMAKTPTYYWLLSNLYRAQQQYQKSLEALDNLSLTDEALFNRVLLYLDLRNAPAAQTAYHELKNQNAEMAAELSFLSLLNPESTQTPALTRQEVPITVTEPRKGGE